MADQKTELLEQLLEREQARLSLIMELDHIRDSAKDPAAMLSAIVNLLADRLDADLSLLMLADRETGTLELKAMNDRSKRFGTPKVEGIRKLAQDALEDGQTAIVKGEAVGKAFGTKVAAEAQMAVVPVVMGASTRLGSLMLLRADAPFSVDDVALLEAAETQVDSAIIQGYVYYELELRNRELEVIYRVDRIRDQNLVFDDMLTAVLDELRMVMQSEIGFIMLYDNSGKQLEMRAASPGDLFSVLSSDTEISDMANDSLAAGALVHRDKLGNKLHGAICVPLILHEEILGVFGVVNGPRSGDFDEREHRMLEAIASQMDTAIFESLEKRRLKRVLGRSVGPRVMERLLADPDVGFLQGERQMLTVLYVDLRGSTDFASRTKPEDLVSFMNEYLGRMSEVILKHDATLDKFVGDEVMALFGAPFPQTDHALRAIRVALEMQVTHQSLLKKWKKKKVDVPDAGIGMATGELTVGEMGSEQRTDYTAIGPAANLGARLCGIAGPGQILIDDATYEMVKDDVKAEPLTGIKLKGVGDNLTVYNVTGLKG